MIYHLTEPINGHGYGIADENGKVIATVTAEYAERFVKALNAPTNGGRIGGKMRMGSMSPAEQRDMARLGGIARAANLTAEQQSAIGRKAAAARKDSFQRLTDEEIAQRLADLEQSLTGADGKSRKQSRRTIAALEREKERRHHERNCHAT